MARTVQGAVGLETQVVWPAVGLGAGQWRSAAPTEVPLPALQLEVRLADRRSESFAGACVASPL